MKNAFRMPLLVSAVIVLASGLTLHAAAAPPNHANRLEASFTESAASITNRIADLGTFQLINTGSGTVEGFGAATVVVGITQDRSVTPCGPGSWTNAATRRIVLQEGVLVLRELAIRCPTDSGPRHHGHVRGRRPVEHGNLRWRTRQRREHGQYRHPYVHALREAEARRLND